jgi:hypothetical protein
VAGQELEYFNAEFFLLADFAGFATATLHLK